ncbi:hypothetical protein M0804_007837 [Polistes exclamans]|nr:hypothetical protein M0804_007837 [Polistes exclamans]
MQHEDLLVGDRSIDYAWYVKVRDLRSGWQAMCTDPGRSSKQCRMTRNVRDLQAEFERAGKQPSNQANVEWSEVEANRQPGEQADLVFRQAPRLPPEPDRGINLR